jgi:hypothetical protein
METLLAPLEKHRASKFAFLKVFFGKFLSV